MYELLNLSILVFRSRNPSFSAFFCFVGIGVPDKALGVVTSEFVEDACELLELSWMLIIT